MSDEQTLRARPDIEAMVREAIARIVAEGAGRSGAVAIAGVASPPKAAQQPASANALSHGETLMLTERLITAATLKGRLAGVRQCVALPQAVVTPAAKDLLRDKGVTLTFARTDASEPMSKSVDEARRLTLVVADAKFNPAPLAAALGREGIKIDSIAKTELLAAIDALSAAVCAGANEKGSRVILFTRETPAAVCLANRIGGVRAASAAHARDAINAVRSAGANVLVIDPVERSFWEVLQTAKAFALPGARECPLPWKARLG